MPREGRIWRVLIVANVIVTLLLAIWVVLFATGTDSLLPPALDPNAEIREEVAASEGREDRPESTFNDVFRSEGEGLETWGQPTP